MLPNLRNWNKILSCFVAGSVFLCNIVMPVKILCLQRNRNDLAFDSKCKSVVIRRMIEQNTDYRLNPLLQKSCRYDISKFCADIVAKENKNEQLDDKVILCLKVMYVNVKEWLTCELFKSYTNCSRSS